MIYCLFGSRIKLLATCQMKHLFFTLVMVSLLYIIALHYMFGNRISLVSYIIFILCNNMCCKLYSHYDCPSIKLLPTFLLTVCFRVCVPLKTIFHSSISCPYITMMAIVRWSDIVYCLRQMGLRV